MLLHHVVTFVAGPTHRAFVLCHQIAPLSRAAHKAILHDNGSTALWDAILKEDYGVEHIDSSLTNVNRRSCKRLKRSRTQRVREAHGLLSDNTEIAFFYLQEMNHSSTHSLSHARLCQLINEYGPYLRINKVTSSGGTFLVECCRARHVRENVIKKCVQELVERNGASVNGSTHESAMSSLTALCVAAARGMYTVIKYLLMRDASCDMRGTGRFRLHTRRNKTVRCTNATPLEFAQTMRDAEHAEGATDREIVNLDKCIRLLRKHTNKEAIE